MATLIVPPLDETPWPTLGPQVCDWIEEHLVYGPGDLKGQPYQVEPEFRAQLYRAYEVFPRGHKREGRRRFNRVALSLRKGTAKTEKAAIVAACEAHPDAPVRCDGFRRQGRSWLPVGRGVQDPYIPLLAYTKDQTEELGFNVLRIVLEEALDQGRLDDGVFDIGLERILVLSARGREAGRVVPLAGSPNARDGARTTFQHFDETHRLNLPRLVSAHTTMLENAFKRRTADPWSLETTTAGVPGEASVAESTHAYAEAVGRGEVEDPRLFYFHRQAADDRPLDNPDDVRAAVLEASGPAGEWSGDIDGLVSRYFEPKTDRAYWCQVWLNQWRPDSAAAFDLARWAELEVSLRIEPGELAVAGFDGSIRKDSTVLVSTDVVTGLQELIGAWERPPNADDDWEVPRDEVTEAVVGLSERCDLYRLYGDPYRWGPWLDEWEGMLGPRDRSEAKRVFRWDTTKFLRMAWAVHDFTEALRTGEATHAPSEVLDRHIGNARKHKVAVWTDDGEQLHTLTKEKPWRKIDGAIAAVLSWKGRSDALAAGAQKRQRVFRAAGF